VDPAKPLPRKPRLQRAGGGPARPLPQRRRGAASVEEAADFIGALLDAAGVQQAALVGHSWGSLIALEAAARLKERVSHLVLVGTAFPMKVSPALIEASLNEPEKALHHGQRVLAQHAGAPPSALGPGTWVYGASMALGRRVLRSNPAVNVFHRGFVACDSYANGETGHRPDHLPGAVPAGRVDQMTPPKAAQGLISKAREAGKTVQVATCRSATTR
jgi:pimeloyl-ACP methyl ester carboxylesterase